MFSKCFASSSSPAVAIARLTPGLFVAGPITSGILGVKYASFVLRILAAVLFADAAVITPEAATGYGYCFFVLSLPSSYAVGAW